MQLERYVKTRRWQSNIWKCAINLTVRTFLKMSLEISAMARRMRILLILLAKFPMDEGNVIIFGTTIAPHFKRAEEPAIPSKYL